MQFTLHKYAANACGKLLRYSQRLLARVQLLLVLGAVFCFFLTADRNASFKVNALRQRQALELLARLLHAHMICPRAEFFTECNPLLDALNTCAKAVEQTHMQAHAIAMPRLAYKWKLGCVIGFIISFAHATRRGDIQLMQIRRLSGGLLPISAARGWCFLEQSQRNKRH